MNTRSPHESIQSARDYYAGFGGAIPRPFVPLLAILDWVEQAKLDHTLYITADLSGLWVSDRPHDCRGDHILNVNPHGLEFLFFEYHHVWGSTDGMRKVVRYADAVETFRQFLVHKFGIYRKPENKNDA